MTTGCRGWCFAAAEPERWAATKTCGQKGPSRFNLRTKWNVDVQWRRFAAVRNAGKIHEENLK
jgi:hypothetical protein